MSNKTPVSVTKPFTLETFIKQTTKLKITTNVLEDFIQTLDELAGKITQTSETYAIKEQRKTIMPQDLEKALDEILKRCPLSVDELLQKIEPLSITELSDLSQKIKKLAEELLKPASTRRLKR